MPSTSVIEENICYYKAPLSQTAVYHGTSVSTIAIHDSPNITSDTYFGSVRMTNIKWGMWPTIMPIITDDKWPTVPDKSNNSVINEQWGAIKECQAPWPIHFSRSWTEHKVCVTRHERAWAGSFALEPHTVPYISVLQGLFPGLIFE